MVLGYPLGSHLPARCGHVAVYVTLVVSLELVITGATVLGNVSLGEARGPSP